MSFFVKACIAGLKELPAVNAEIEGDDLVYKNYYDVGVAVGTPVACIGLAHAAESEAEVTALAVLPDWRRQGLATSLIFGAAEQLGLRALHAETDRPALDFFRATGFSVEGVTDHDGAEEHFRCRLALPRP